MTFFLWIVTLVNMTIDSLSTMPERVKYARKQAGFSSQSAIAEAIGVTRDAYAWYETKALMPSEHIEKFSKATGFQINWLITGKGHPKERTLNDALIEAAEIAESANNQFVAETLKMLMDRKNNG